MIANLLTLCRVIISFVMLLFPVYSVPFYCCYLTAGFTDVLDGAIARKLGTANDFGARLDSIADLMFAAAASYKLLPVMTFSIKIWIWIGLITLIKGANLLSGYVIHRRFVSVHTAANKVTGLLLFLYPLVVSVLDFQYSADILCVAATFAAIQEGHFIRTRSISS